MMTENNFNAVDEVRSILGWGEDVSLGAVTITPEMASRLLVFNTDNRKLNMSTVERYAQSLSDGSFTMSNDMITFDDDGVLTNGQHRLHAVKQSGCKLETVVSIGVSQSSEMDRGLMRNVVENIKRWADIPDELRTTDAVSASNALMFRLEKRKKFNNAKLEKFMRENAKVIELAYENGLLQSTGAVKKVYSTTISSAFLAAILYYRDKYKDDEEKFSTVVNDMAHIRDVLTTGVSKKDGDQFIIKLRDRIKDTDRGSRKGNSDMIFRSVQYVIYNYCAGKPKTKILHDKNYFI